MPDYLVTVHHKDEYRSITVFASEPNKRAAKSIAVKEVEGLGAPGPWRATSVERITREG